MKMVSTTSAAHAHHSAILPQLDILQCGMLFDTAALTFCVTAG